MSIGPTVLAQAVESLRKLRNSARFCLGNMGPKEVMEGLKRANKAEMNIVSGFSISDADLY